MESYNEIEEAKIYAHAEKDDESDEPSFSSFRTHARGNTQNWRREFFLTISVQRIQILNEQLYPSSPRSISFLPRARARNDEKEDGGGQFTNATRWLFSFLMITIRPRTFCNLGISVRWRSSSSRCVWNNV